MGKAKAICTCGGLSVHIQALKDVDKYGPIFNFYVIADDGEIKAHTVLNLDEVVFLTKCLDNTVNTLMTHSVESEWFDGND